MKKEAKDEETKPEDIKEEPPTKEQDAVNKKLSLLN
jgi:hypothetical protein